MSENKARPAALPCSPAARAHPLQCREHLKIFFPILCLSLQGNPPNSFFLLFCLHCCLSFCDPSLKTVCCKCLTLDCISYDPWPPVAYIDIHVSVQGLVSRVWGPSCAQGTGSQWIKLLIPEHTLWATSPARLWLHQFHLLGPHFPNPNTALFAMDRQFGFSCWFQLCALRLPWILSGDRPGRLMFHWKPFGLLFPPAPFYLFLLFFPIYLRCLHYSG